MRLTSLELFSGCGGLAKGLENAGFEHRAFVEFNAHACASLRQNFAPALVHEMDVRDFNFASVGSVDLIAGGPPCQPFSLGGLAKAQDDRRDMFPQAARAISEVRPKAFIFENVKGLLRKGFVHYFEYIVRRLTFPDCSARPDEPWQEHAERLGHLQFETYAGLKYRVQYRLLNAADFGVPQIRERVFIVGVRADLPAEWAWPEPTVAPEKRLTVRDAVEHLPDPRLADPALWDHTFIDGARVYPGHTGSAIDKPGKTIKAGAHGVPGGENMIRFEDGSVRYMSVREAKLIQTFPEDFKILGTWGEALRQIGNAVPVRLAEIIGRSMARTLRETQPPVCEVRMFPLKKNDKRDFLKTLLDARVMV